jgi:exopolyphosphatase / guanosine-5'-triphosphate,3'-diphosphate pyrophosphatase
MRIAAIDVGSNSIHMVVAEVSTDGRFHVLDRAKEMARLGRRSLATGRLSAAAMEEGLRILRTFKTLAARHGAQRYKAVATSAVREATNGGDFIQRVHDEVGLRVKVIPGREEARLVSLGVRHAVELQGQPAVVLDLGGGSLEVILFDNGAPAALHSLKLGVARLAEKYLDDGSVSARALKGMEEAVETQLGPVLEPLVGQGIARVVGTSGTLLSLVGVLGHLRDEPPGSRLNGFAVTAAEVAGLWRFLRKSKREERLRLKGLDAKRADFIVPGALVADFALRRLGAAELVACTWALREGVLLDWIARHQKRIEETARFDDVRRRSVHRFLRHIGGDGAHGGHVARLATRLFDQLGDRLGLERESRDWLEFAALLHDVGHAIDHENHHRHAYYLITHGELLGFRPGELEIIGQTARYHRKGTPKGSDPDLAALPVPTRRTVRSLAALLRVADGLDRSHYGVVKDVRARERSGSLVLELTTGGEDAALEIWEATRRSELLGKVLHRPVRFRVVA